jgi:hypothetical protein
LGDKPLRFGYRAQAVVGAGEAKPGKSFGKHEGGGQLKAIGGAQRVGAEQALGELAESAGGIDLMP